MAYDGARHDVHGGQTDTAPVGLRSKANRTAGVGRLAAVDADHHPSSRRTWRGSWLRAVG